MNNPMHDWIPPQHDSPWHQAPSLPSHDLPPHLAYLVRSVAESVRKKTATEAAVAQALNPQPPPEEAGTPGLEQIAAMLAQGQQGAPGVAPLDPGSTNPPPAEQGGGTHPDLDRLKQENDQLEALLHHMRGGQGPSPSQ
jgi:hypothetical protein